MYVEMGFQLNLYQQQKTVQDFCARRRNIALYNVRKFESNVQCHARLLLKDWNGALAMAFYFPSMCSVVNGNVLLGVVVVHASVRQKVTLLASS